MRKADIYTAVIFILYSVVGFFYIIPTQIEYSIPPEEVSNAVFLPTFFPNSAVITFGLVSAMFLFGAFRRSEAGGQVISGKRALLQVCAVFVLCYVYVEAMAYFGFLVSTPVFLAILVVSMGTRDWRYVAAMSILFPLVVNYFFWFAFKLALPEGSLFS
ncbi:MAG: tripartite tricarboxylate transporter TctB family protein [Nitrospinae bacterium]|nr:tripartite tricarboxylate transporter TctB family protein [Nitrospinota bacterium]